MGVWVNDLVNNEMANANNRKPSCFPTQNNLLCIDCGWEGDNPAKVEGTTISCCPKCGNNIFKEVMKPEYAKLPPIDKKAPFEGERKHIKHGPWRIY